MLSAQEKIGRLETLLGRIQHNATLPRTPSPAVAAAASEEPEPTEAPAAAAPAPPLGAVQAQMDAEISVEEDVEFDEVEIDDIEAEEVEIEVEETAPAKEPRLPPTGPREAAAGLEEPEYEDDHGEALEAEIPSGDGAASPGHAGGPTMEQLGETVELAGATSSAADLELDTSKVDAPPKREEMEAALPRGEFHGAYDDSLAPPPEAAQELEAHRLRQEAKAAEAREARRIGGGSPAGQLADLSAQRRPIPAGSKVAQTMPREAPRTTRTFVELLDESLGL